LYKYYRTPSSATVAGGFSCGKTVFLLCCFLFISGTALFAQNANGQTDSRPAVYPAAPDLFGGTMGIDRESLSKEQISLPFPASRSSENCNPKTNIPLISKLRMPAMQPCVSCLIARLKKGRNDLFPFLYGRLKIKMNIE
jgi:hypothetical protein